MYLLLFLLLWHSINTVIKSFLWQFGEAKKQGWNFQHFHESWAWYGCHVRVTDHDHDKRHVSSRAAVTNTCWNIYTWLTRLGVVVVCVNLKWGLDQITTVIDKVRKIPKYRENETLWQKLVLSTLCHPSMLLDLLHSFKISTIHLKIVVPSFPFTSQTLYWFHA